MGRRWRLVGVSMLSVAVLLGACSSDDSSSAPDPSEKVVLEAYGIAPASAADLEQAATIVQERLGALDVRDASVKVKGQNLVATGTGVGEAAAKALQPGLLELRPVVAVLPPETPGSGGEAAPEGDVLPSRNVSGHGDRYQVGPSVLDGAQVSSATAQDLGGDQGWAVTLKLDAAGTTAFDALARESYPKPPPQNSVAIVLDGIVQTAPAFQAATFDGGEVQISGSFTEAEAKQLATILRFGSVPVPLRIAG